jgi:hypothetical protein
MSLQGIGTLISSLFVPTTFTREQSILKRSKTFLASITIFTIGLELVMVKPLWVKIFDFLSCPYKTRYTTYFITANFFLLTSDSHTRPDASPIISRAEALKESNRIFQSIIL